MTDIDKLWHFATMGALHIYQWVMTMATSLNISLSDELKEKASEQVTRRHFSNASDYVRHLIREDVKKHEAQEELRELLLQGLRSEISDKSPEEFFAELREYIKSKNK